MNVSMGRILTLSLALSVAFAATACAADDGQSQSTGHVLTAQEKAIEAQRLAKQAAALAKQAAALAAESQKESASATSTTKDSTSTASTAKNSSEKKQSTTPKEQNWTSRDSAEVKISDSSPTLNASGSKVTGWRGHQDTNDVAIRFKDDKSNSAAPVTPAAATEKTASEAVPDRQSVNDANIHLAARIIADRDLQNSNDSEPMPTPAAANGSNNKDSKDASTNGNVANPGQCGCNGGYGCGGGCNSCCGGCNSCGCNSCCGGCNSCCDMGGCCNPSPCLFWTGGVEATFLSPNLNDNGATFDFKNVGDERDCFSSTNGLDSLYVAPRIWLGVESCCWGVDVKYWQMRASANGWDPAVGQGGLWDGADCGVPDVGHFSGNSMSAYALDLEVSRRLCVRDCWMQFSGGVRHAEFRHDEFMTGNIQDTLNGDTTSEVVHAIGYARDDSFSQGTGIVLGWYGRRPVFPCSCVNWFYNLHYSVLWGPTNTAAETAAILVADDPGSAGSTNGARTHSDGTFTIGEVQVGLEWDYCLQCLPANAFFLAALEYQRWDGGHGDSSSQTFAGATLG